jgi:hypothetical protein
LPADIHSNSNNTYASLESAGLAGQKQHHQAISSSWAPKLHHHMRMQIRNLEKNLSKNKKLQTLPGILLYIKQRFLSVTTTVHILHVTRSGYGVKLQSGHKPFAQRGRPKIKSGFRSTTSSRSSKYGASDIAVLVLWTKPPYSRQPFSENILLIMLMRSIIVSPGDYSTAFRNAHVVPPKSHAIIQNMAET